ncbi:MAG: TIGR00730 family Rossman fold protein, partial [Alphaproteobacteria bacterium]|nr:TIGR00730 family Rossman fold protein [Alphaproteobacteria bacterium]
MGLFCSASDGLPDAYRAAAAEFGRLCAARGFRLVYGGSGRGLMGAAAHAALDGGGDVVGVMPRHLVERERAETRLADLRIVDSLAARKQVMAELSDVFFVLPGGVGTLDEAFEMITW